MPQDSEHYRKSTLHELIPYRRMERFLKTILDSSDDGIWVTDGQGNILYNNAASEKLTGVKTNQLVGKNMAVTLEREYWEFSVTLRALETKKRYSAIQHMRLTGKKLLSTATPVLGDNGDVILVVSNERDITRLTELQEQLEQARKREEKYKEELAQIKQIEAIKEKFVVESEAMAKIIRTALKLAELEESDILLFGESGTGKGMLARLIHDISSRGEKPFVVINCAALPETLLEAELFGYEKGAFTGARDDGKVGLIELAHQGTLFLDEVGDMPLSIQAKLLTYLDNRTVMRLGGVKERQIECCIIAATNRDLEALVKEKLFRQDLYFRLNTFSLEIPPLRKRQEDVFALLNYFLERYNRKYGEKKRLRHATIEKLIVYDFPGNVRELKNLIKRSVATCEHQYIDDDILRSVRIDAAESRPDPEASSKKRMDLNERLQAYERIILKDAMSRCKTTREMAAFLNISQPSVIRKMKKADLKILKNQK